jgi:hypothetical protein
MRRIHAAQKKNLYKKVMPSTFGAINRGIKTQYNKK